MKRTALLFLAALSITGAVMAASAPTPAPDPIPTIPQLRLPNGKILTNVQLRSYSGDPVSARWDGGAGTLRRQDLPAAIRDQLPAARKSMTDSTGRPLLTAETGEARTLKGQVFISTRGGENAKLGAVSVFVYSAADYAAQMKWLQLGPLAKLKVSQKKLDGLEKGGETTESAALRTAMTEDFRKAYATIAVPVNGTKTDADGRFTLNHKVAAPYVLCAIGDRTVGEETEHYRWVLPSEKITDPANVLLFTANETGFTK